MKDYDVPSNFQKVTGDILAMAEGSRFDYVVHPCNCRGVMDNNWVRQGTIEVEADSRVQAASIAKKNGYIVRDVNMIG